MIISDDDEINGEDEFSNNGSNSNDEKGFSNDSNDIEMAISNGPTVICRNDIDAEPLNNPEDINLILTRLQREWGISNNGIDQLITALKQPSLDLSTLKNSAYLLHRHEESTYENQLLVSYSIVSTIYIIVLYELY